jgi:8-hydroxy-5-deazaflavin:NADPH oxidoreductase
VDDSGTTVALSTPPYSTSPKPWPSELSSGTGVVANEGRDWLPEWPRPSCGLAGDYSGAKGAVGDDEEGNEMMRVATLGAGMMTEALAGQWVRAGYEVMVGGRSPEKAAALAGRIGAKSGTLAEASAFGDSLLLAVRQAGLVATLEAAGAPDGALAGKTVIDCGNAVDVSDFSLITWEGKSLAEQAQHLAPGSYVVKAFNLCHANVWQMSPPVFDGRPLAVPFAGGDEGKPAAIELIEALGCTPLDAGDLPQARHLEAMAIVVIRLLFSGYDPLSVFAFNSPGQTGKPFTSR